MSGVDHRKWSVVARVRRERNHQQFHAWKFLTRALAVMSMLLASVSSFWWFGSPNALAAGGQGGGGGFNPAASMSQCTNGAVGPPIDAQPCVGSNAAAISVAIPGINGGASTSYKNWVTGNANGNNSHWSEGDFISYRAAVSGLRTGETHTLVFHYDTVNTGLHAVDYLGSFDGTETTSTSPTTVNGQVVNANNNNPCADLITETENCNPSAPASSRPIPSADLAGASSCDAAPGTFSGTQEPGAIDLFGPQGSAITGVTYLSQNVLSGTGTCTTTVQVSFTVPHNIGKESYVVLAWGGHIASERDWGSGNAASSISGSPYHMSLDSIDGQGGSQDLSLQTSAIYFLPTVSTVVYDDGAPATSSVAPGSTVYDTAKLTGALSTAGGTVQYLLYSNLTCSGEQPISNESVTVTNGVVPQSKSFLPAAGLYSYMAFYSGDSKDLPARSPCEPFAVGTAAPSVTTVVYNASTDQPISSPIPAGVSVYDTAKLTYSGTELPTGTVTYTFYSGGTCTTGTPVGSPDTVTLNADGTVPQSSVQGPLTSAGGPYAFKASYSGDTNYLSGASDCETFEVGEGVITLSTKIYLANQKPRINSISDQPVEGPVPVGSSVYDTATLQYGGPIPTGTVTYTLLSGASDCVAGTTVTTETVDVSDGTVPNSAETSILDTAGPYAFKVVYSGDENYPSGDSVCEPFSVGQELPTLTTVPYSSSTNQPVTGALPLGSSIYDTATIAHYGTLEPTGTVTYTFYKGGSDCESGTIVGEPESVAVRADGTVPSSQIQSELTDSDGPYAFSASYSGDENFLATDSACEPITVTGVIIGGGVLQGTPTISTTVYDASNNLPVGNLAPGATVYDTVSFANLANIDPTGTVTYTFFTGGNCVTGTVVGTPQTVTISAHGTVPFSPTQGPLTASGSPYAFQASYSGDGNYLGDTSDCEPFTVGQALLTVTTALSATSTSVGVPVYDTAQLVGATSDAGGTATYAVYSDSACTSFIQNVSTETVTAGKVPNSAQVSFSSPGTYYFQVYYTGDGENTPARSICAAEVLTVTPVPIGAAQTGVAPTGGSSSGSPMIILLFGGGLVMVGAGILVRRRWPIGIRKH